MERAGGTPTRVLFVGTETANGTNFHRPLEQAPDLSVVLAHGSAAALAQVDEGVDCVVCIPEEAVDGIAVLDRIRSRDPDLPIVLVGSDVGSDAGRAASPDGVEYVPWTDANAGASLVEHIRKAIGNGPHLRADGTSRMPIEDLAVREELRLKERAMDEAPVGITISDPEQPDNPLIYVNDAFEALTGYSKEETVGRNCRFLQGEQSDAAAVEAMREAIDRQEPVSVELLNYRKNGETFWNKVDIAPIRDDRGRVTNYVGFQTDVTARKEAELAVDRERQQLDHLLSRINGLIQDVTSALVEAVGRDDIDRAVCDRLAADDTYAFAWIGEPDLADDQIVPTAWAGAWDPEATDLTVDLSGAAADQDPVARSYRTGELQIVTDPDATATVTSRSNWMTEGDVRGIAAIPLEYRNTRYGVLTVLTTEVDALNERETVVLEALGRATATAINALERGRILVADSVVELEFAIRDPDLFFVDVSAREGCDLEYNGSVSRDDGSVLMFFTTDADPDAVEAIAMAHADVRSVTVVNGSADESLIEFAVDENSIIATLAERGARTRSIAISGGSGRIVIELPTEADARSIVELLRDRYDQTELVAFRERERPPETKQEFIADLRDRLTERQLTALQTAYVSGYYEWNRPVSGDELAASMGVARSTYHQHLRAAERKLVGAIFER